MQPRVQDEFKALQQYAFNTNSLWSKLMKIFQYARHIKTIQNEVLVNSASRLHRLTITL